MTTNNLCQLLVILSFCLSFPDLQAQDRLPEILKQVKPSVVVILTFDKLGKAIGQGSGFLVSSKGDVITNSHVLENSNQVAIKTLEGNMYPIKKIGAEDKQGDLVHIKAEIAEPVKHYLSLSSSVPDEGERIIVVGSPFGLEGTVSDGIVSAVRELPGFGKVIQITAPISPGSSGSPVINMKGEVIGVATFYSIEGQNLNFAIPNTRVKRLLEEAASIWNDNGHHASKRNDFNTAIQHFSTALELFPNYTIAYHNRGNSYYRLKEYQRAISDYSRAIELAPNVSYFFNSRGNVYAEIGQYQMAIADYEQGINLDPDLIVNYLTLGTLYQETKQYQEAVLIFNQAILRDSLNPILYLSRAINFILIGEYKKAIGDLDKGIESTEYLDKRVNEFDEYMANAYSNRAYCYGALGYFEKAYEEINKALALETKNPETFYNISRFYAKQGKNHEALGYLKNAIINGFTDYDWINRDHDFDNIRNTIEFQTMLKYINQGGDN